ncbi:hypothetical protein RB601_004025 [Gaeumannomyces tritici]
MSFVIYSLESHIEEFFKASTTTTREECDVKTASFASGAPVVPVPMQGAWSYTVTAGPDQARIVQFRPSNATLNMSRLELARQAHPRCVPKCTYHGQTGRQLPLDIYVMDKAAGECYLYSRNISPEGTEDKARFDARQHRTVRDLARFFADSWSAPQKVSPAVADGVHQKLELDLDRLDKAFPDRFSITLNQVRDSFTRLFSLPWVITHVDLNETNILVDDTGAITAIIDWADAEMLPFGMSLWGLENILGYMDGTGWHYHGNAQELRDEFWRVFKASVGGVGEEAMAAIRIARMVGLFMRYCFALHGSGDRTVLDANAATLRYADAFCTRGI